MAIGGSPTGAPRAKDGSKGAAGRFSFVVEASRGYMGALWTARDSNDASEAGTVLVRHVTPLVAATARAAILEGARWAIAGADSPTFEVLEARNAVDLITPFVDGEPLRSLLRTAAVKHAAMEPALVLGVAHALVEELDSIHRRAGATQSPHGFGGVHPDSIVIDLSGHVHLLDMGAGAAASAREPWRSDPQRIGYFAPEQTEARVRVDARSDVFAVGVMLWEALANRRLFPGNDAKTARERVQKAPIARLDATRPSATGGIATPIAALVARCLERDPALRFQSMAELLAALGAHEHATPERIGAWVAALADATIAKRRHFLERAAAGLSIPPSPRVEDRESLPPPSAGERRTAPPQPSVRPAPRLSVPPPKPTSKAPHESATPPPPPSARTAAIPPSGTATPPPPPSARTAAHPPSATATPAPVPRAPSATATPAPVPRAPSATATPAPIPRAPSATATPAPIPRAPSATATPAPPAVAPDPAMTPMPPSTSSVPPRPRNSAPPPPVEPLTEPSTDAKPALAEDATSTSAGEMEPPARERADSVEAIDAEDDDEDTEDDVEDDDEGSQVESEDVRPSVAPLSKRPPPLPHEMHPEGTVAFGASHGEPLARPIHQSALSSLTAPSAATNKLPKTVGVIALVFVVGFGAWVLGRARMPHTVIVQVPKRENVVETPPVRIEERLSEVPSASAGAPSETPAGAAPSASAAAATPPASVSATEAPAPAASDQGQPKGEQKTATPRPPRATIAPAEAPHRPPEPHESGYKPGGI